MSPSGRPAVRIAFVYDGARLPLDRVDREADARDLLEQLRQLAPPDALRQASFISGCSSTGRAGCGGCRVANRRGGFDARSPTKERAASRVRTGTGGRRSEEDLDLHPGAIIVVCGACLPHRELTPLLDNQNSHPNGECHHHASRDGLRFGVRQPERAPDFRPERVWGFRGPNNRVRRSNYRDSTIAITPFSGSRRAAGTSAHKRLPAYAIWLRF